MSKELSLQNFIKVKRFIYKMKGRKKGYKNKVKNGSKIIKNSKDIKQTTISFEDIRKYFIKIINTNNGR